MQKRAKALAATKASAKDLYELARDAQKLEERLKAVATSSRAGVLATVEQLRQLPHLRDLDVAAVERLINLAPNEGHIKGQLLEELLNARMAKAEELAANVPSKVLKEVKEQGLKLEFIPGHAIKDANGQLLTDGVIGFWKNDRFHIVTFFESKGGAAAGRGLRRKWTGIPRAERPDLIKEAQSTGLSKMRELDQDAGEALAEAVAELKKRNPKKFGALTTDEVIQKFPNDVERSWGTLSQSEAGQIRKTTERVTDVGEMRLYGRPTPITSATGGTPHAVGVLPSDVSQASLREAMEKGGIQSFERLKNVPVTQADLNSLAKEIAKAAGIPTAPP